MNLMYPWPNSVITILAQFYGLFLDKSVRLLKIMFMVLIFPTFGRRRMKRFAREDYFYSPYFYFRIKNLKENLVYTVCIFQKWQVRFWVNK